MARVRRTFYVYIMSSASRTLYIGVTNNLVRRAREHKSKCTAGFTSRYNVDRLVYWTSFTDVRDAISCEKKMKGWTRAKKVALIKTENKEWRDLTEEWETDQNEPVA